MNFAFSIISQAFSSFSENSGNTDPGKNDAVYTKFAATVHDALTCRDFSQMNGSHASNAGITTASKCGHISYGIAPRPGGGSSTFTNFKKPAKLFRAIASSI